MFFCLLFPPLGLLTDKRLAEAKLFGKDPTEHPLFPHKFYLFVERFGIYGAIANGLYGLITINVSAAYLEAYILVYLVLVIAHEVGKSDKMINALLGRIFFAKYNKLKESSYQNLNKSKPSTATVMPTTEDSYISSEAHLPQVPPTNPEVSDIELVPRRQPPLPPRSPTSSNQSSFYQNEPRPVEIYELPPDVQQQYYEEQYQ